ncbi:MAG: tubulin-like doman-containing protein [Bryobacteraceae bacterium]
MVGSLCGGTGSGMFLDLAYDLRRWAKGFTNKDVTVTGHLVLPEAFRNKPVVMRSLEANCYAALQELDHFMNGSQGEGWCVEYEPDHVDVSRDVPFNYCYLLSGLQQGGVMDVEGLAAMIGETLFLLTATEVGRRAVACAINANAQGATVRDSRERLCCYSSYGVLGVEIPSELLGQSLGAGLASDARLQLLQPAPKPDHDLDRQVVIVPASLGVTVDNVQKLVPVLQLDMTPVALLIDDKQERAAGAMIPGILSQARAELRRQAEQQAARQICGGEELRAAVRQVLLSMLPRASGFDRSLAFLQGLLSRLRQLQQTLSSNAQQAKGETDIHRAAADLIDRHGVRVIKEWEDELRPWKVFYQLEAKERVFQGQGLQIGRLADGVDGLIERWQHIRTLFVNLRLRKADDEIAYYRVRPSRTGVCPLAWFITLLDPFREAMIERILAGLVEEFDTWSQVSAAELSSRFYALCTRAMHDHFQGEAGMTCDRLLADCYKHPSDRYREMVSALSARARASWEIHETYPHRNNILEIVLVGAASDSLLSGTLRESNPQTVFLEDEWPDYVPVLRVQHGSSLIGLKRLQDYRRSFVEAITLEQRYDMHFFLDYRWVTDLPFPDDDLRELALLRLFSLAEREGALKRSSGGYAFIANGQQPVRLDPFRHRAFEQFRVNEALIAEAENLVFQSGILLRNEELEYWRIELIRKLRQAHAYGVGGAASFAARAGADIQQAPAHGVGGSASVTVRPMNREVFQVHQELRAVRAAMSSGGGPI